MAEAMTAAAAARAVHQGRNRRSRGGRLFGGGAGPGVGPKASGFRWADYSYPLNGSLRKAALLHMLVCGRNLTKGLSLLTISRFFEFP